MSEMETWAAIQAGDITPQEVCVMDPKFHYKYKRTIEKIHAIVMRKRWRTEMTKGVWLVGPSDACKTWVFDGYSSNTHFVKTMDNQWWDGYKQQDTVILNDSTGKIPFDDLFALVDKWPHTVKVRRRDPVPFISKQVIVCSVFTPEECYRRTADRENPGPWEQFLRRFEVRDLTKGTISFPTPPIPRSNLPTVFRKVAHEMPPTTES